MAKRMLIDASHSEETRVVVVNGNRLEEFDFETTAKKQLKGNVYLAKVTRVEPSLQAAFVDYGGNRHGFLAFSEIHPDYYQIPIADREALVEQESEETEAEGTSDDKSTDSEESDVETVSGDDVDEIDRRRAAQSRSQASRKYKMQEVIKKRQILLIQVVKEERSNKGAALTTYLSLAGRYCVLMPNTPRGGGISRKIVDPDDRKRLKQITGKLLVNSRMGVIVRTAGMSRTKAEIKRDFDYLLRFWNDIREKTLQSTAPTLIHEEANLINRSLRDLYTSDIDEILVEGEHDYKTCKEFMRMMIPSHARKVKRYADQIPMFIRYQVEGQLDALHSSDVELDSGGSIVINPTEALVAIDVNSGRATKTRNIEETAKNTNMEAAAEIARQLRLRDLAGLIVVDFIDMADRRNDRQVEKHLKEAMKSDRARIQVGKISPFGLLEFSRQRLRPSFLELNTTKCPACDGAGLIRSTESSALQVLRAVDDEGMRGRTSAIQIIVPNAVALYILNNKRTTLTDMEDRYGVRVLIAQDPTLIPPSYRIELVDHATGEVREVLDTGGEETKPRRRRRTKSAAVDLPAEDPAEVVAKDDTVASAEDEPAPPKRRRRGRRGGRRRSAARESAAVGEPGDEKERTDTETGPEAQADLAAVSEGADQTFAGDAKASGDGGQAEKPKRPRRRRRPAAKAKASGEDESASETGAPDTGGSKTTAAAAEDAGDGNGQGAPDVAGDGEVGTGETTDAEKIAEPAESSANDVADISAGVLDSGDGDSEKPRRRGWWRRSTPSA